MVTSVLPPPQIPQCSLLPPSIPPPSPPPPPPTGSSVLSSKKPAKSKKKKRDPNAPKGTKGAFFYYLEETKPGVLAGNPGFNRKEQYSKISDMWKNLGDADRAVYTQMSQKDGERYKEEIKNYVPPSGYGKNGLALSEEGGQQSERDGEGHGKVKKKRGRPKKVADLDEEGNLVKKKKKKKKKRKPADHPRGPMGPFMLFAKDIREAKKTEDPNAIVPHAEIGENGRQECEATHECFPRVRKQHPSYSL